MQRLYFLDGLRGWGAVVVLLYHVFCDALPINDFARDALKFFLPFNAMIAVNVFFFVSGFALATPYFATGRQGTLIKLAAGRYPRLAIPIFASCLVVHVALITGIIAPAPERLAPFDQILIVTPTWLHLVQFSFFDVFFNYSFTSTYIGPLWTMSYELLGSFLVLGCMAIFGRWKWRTWIFAAMSVILLLAGSFQSLFLIGALSADLWERFDVERLPRVVGPAAICLGCLAPFFLPWQITPATLLAAAVLGAGLITSSPTRRFLGNGLSRWLGHISFPLYLIHGPVIMALGAPLVLHFGRDGVVGFAIQLSTVVAAFAAAILFAPVNGAAIKISRWIGKALTEPFSKTAPLATGPSD